MLKILFILVLYFVANTEPKARTLAQTFCSMTDVCPSRTSIACKYISDPGIKCNGHLYKLSQTKILHWHNTRRNLIALGKIPRYDGARRMATMRWSNQLEQMAKYNVATCKFGHDQCRNTRRFTTSGQNLYSVGGDNIPGADEIALNAIKAWFLERKNCNMDIIRKYRKARRPVGHFTSMVKYNSDYVGCALSKFMQNGKLKVLFTCNYASTNIFGKPIYGPGRPGSRCKTGRHRKYRGLCSINENYGHRI